MVCSLLALGSFALYWPTRQFDFVDYDDPEYILKEPEVRRGLSWQGLVWSVVDAHASNWHPLTWLSHMLDCQLFGLRAGPHHLVNALLHGVNGVLLLLALRKMTGALWRSAFVAAVFAWHPLRVESVAWISERKDVLCGLFFMLTLFAYAEFARQFERGNLKSKGWFRAALLCFALGLLSKPMLVSVPFVLLLLDFWPLQRVAGGEWRPPEIFRSKAVRALVVEKIPFFALSLVFCVITLLAQRAGSSVISTKALGAGPRIEFFLAGYPGYLEKLFWPRDLTVLYLRPAAPSGSTVILACLILAGVSIVAALNFRRRPYLIMGWFWFLGMLVPVSSLVQVGLQSIADRYTYLPAIGIALMLAWGGGDLAAALFPARHQRILCGAIASVLLAACLYLARRQLGYWRNTQVLMDQALELNPNNYVAHENLVVYYSRRGEREKSRYHYQRAMESDPMLAGKPEDPLRATSQWQTNRNGVGP